jgi:hypothetical protein
MRALWIAEIFKRIARCCETCVRLRRREFWKYNARVAANLERKVPGCEPERWADMFQVILRSALVGIGALVVTAFFGVLVVLPATLYFLTKRVAPAGGGEVGWDLVSMAHNSPDIVGLIALVALLVFAAGSYFGFRHFSESPARR